MKNIVVYKSSNKIGYRPQTFPEWVEGTKIMCDGEQCLIIAVLPNDRIGIAEAQKMMRSSDIHQHNLAIQRERARARRAVDAIFSNPAAVDRLFSMIP